MSTRAPGLPATPRCRLGLLHGGASYHLRTLDDPIVTARRARPFYLPELAEPAEAAAFRALDVAVVFDRLHPDLVRANTDTLLAVPRRGGTLVVLGEVEAHTWLPGLRFTPQETNFWWWRSGEDPGIQHHHPNHPLWAHLHPDDVVWHYHGLLTPPPGVTALASVRRAEGPPGVILYHDRASTAGNLVVTTMDPVHHHGSNFMPAATRLLHGLLDWLTPTS